MDDNYQTYLNRAIRLILPETHRTQVQNIQESPKFHHDKDNGYQPTPFPGYTLISPPGEEDHLNAGLYGQLTQYQQKLLEGLGSEFFVPIPIDSFHLTLADLIWDGAYRHAQQSRPDFDQQLCQRITDTFEYCQFLTEGNPVRFHALGLMVMTRAIAVCLVPTDESGYDRILKLRRYIYQNSSLIGLGIEQQYYFTPHVTLGYFGAVPSPAERQQFNEQIEALNQQWLELEPQEFLLKQVELRKFDDMTRYYREPDWPVLQL